MSGLSVGYVGYLRRGDFGCFSSFLAFFGLPASGRVFPQKITDSLIFSVIFGYLSVILDKRILQKD
jgi:hypothetical protein